MNRSETIKLLERDSEEFLKSNIGKEILNHKCDDNNDLNIISILCDLEEPLTETINKMKKK